MNRQRRGWLPHHRSSAPITVIFLLNGALYANWVPRIPDIKSRLRLAEDELGLALLCVAVGLLVAQPMTAVLKVRVGARATTAIAAVACCGALPLPALATSLGGLGAALFALGFANGALDVSMNTYAVAFERQLARPIMAFLHGSVSVGIVLGALMGAVAAAQAVPSETHLAVAALGLFVASALSWCRLPRVDESIRDEEGQGSGGLPIRPLVGLSVMAASCLLAEGAIADWSAVYLGETLNATPGVAGTGFIGFMVLMTLGRFSGDRLQARWGAVALGRMGALLAIAGLSIALMAEGPGLAVGGLCLMGAGLSSLFPLILRSAALVTGSRPAVGIALVSTSGYFGFVLGPALIGFLAVRIGLAIALTVVALCLTSVVIFANLLTGPTNVSPRPSAKRGC